MRHSYGVDVLGASEAAPSLDKVRAGKAVIKLGMTGPSVVYIQGCVGAVATGTFDDKTRDAVVAFQTANNLPPSGQVTSTTMAAIDRLARGQGNVVPTPPVTSMPAETVTATPTPVTPFVDLGPGVTLTNVTSATTPRPLLPTLPTTGNSKYILAACGVAGLGGLAWYLLRNRGGSVTPA